MNDNRNYHYSIDSQTLREEYKIIANWIKEGSSVIDLGCGDGSLLQFLKKTKNVNGVGIDLSDSAVLSAVKKGLQAKVGRIDAVLPYINKQFDYAICNVTLQMVMYPEILLSEMRRVAKRQIISFPNFAFILNRLELMTFGRMPKTMLGSYQWFNTGHIHQLSIHDYVRYCIDQRIRIINKYFIYPRPFTTFSANIPDIISNMFATLAIFQSGDI